MVYWNSYLVTEQLVDICSPKPIFDKMNEHIKVPYPYENNTIWRVVFVNPADKNLEIEIRQKISADDDYR